MRWGGVQVTSPPTSDIFVPVDITPGRDQIDAILIQTFK